MTRLAIALVAAISSLAAIPAVAQDNAADILRPTLAQDSPAVETLPAAGITPGVRDGITGATGVGAETPSSEGPPTSAPATTDHLPQEEVQTLRFGVLGGRDVAGTMRRLQPMVTDLGAVLGRPVEIIPMSSYGAMVDAEITRRIDGGFFSAAAFAAADAQCGCVEPLVAPKGGDGAQAYHAIVLARPESGIRSLADLQGKRVAVGAEDSLGARRMQLAGMLAEGVDPSRLGAVYETNSGQDAVQVVANGWADAAFTWSARSGGAANALSSAGPGGAAAAGEAAGSGMAVVWQSAPITHGPLAVPRALAEADKTKIEDFFLHLDQTDADAYDALNPLYGGGYAAVGPDDYAGLAALVSEDIDAVKLPVVAIP